MTINEAIDILLKNANCTLSMHCNIPCTDCEHNVDYPELQEAVVNFGTLAKDTNVPANNNDPVNHPAHYTQGGIECIDAMVSAFGKEAVMIYCRVNAFKYLWRSENKNGLEDISKAVWYLEKYRELSA